MAGSSSVQVSSYETFVDAHVYELVRRGTVHFDLLLLALPSVYPTEVMDSVRRLIEGGQIERRVLTDALACVRPAPRSTAGPHDSSSLAVPHPLDFGWRFSEGATKRLLCCCRALCAPEDPMVFLGTPSLFWSLQSKGMPQQAILLDRDPLTVTGFQRGISSAEAIHCDVATGELPRVRGKLVVADPPWYRDYMESFLWAASVFCTRGGHILLCFPPEGAHPGALEEFCELRRWAEHLGLTLVGVEDCSVSYVSPPFERNALAACGIRTIPSEWRRGNVVILKKTGRLEAKRPPAPSRGGPWQEQTLGRVRIRIRARPIREFVDPGLVTVVPGDVLPSVRRSDGRRKVADVWTSGNRIFACDGCGLLFIVLRSMAARASAEEGVRRVLGRDLSDQERDIVHAAVRQIQGLVETEEDEIDLFF